MVSVPGEYLVKYVFQSDLAFRPDNLKMSICNESPSGIMCVCDVSMTCQVNVLAKQFFLK